MNISVSSIQSCREYDFIVVTRYTFPEDSILSGIFKRPSFGIDEYPQTIAVSASTSTLYFNEPCKTISALIFAEISSSTERMNKFLFMPFLIYGLPAATKTFLKFRSVELLLLHLKTKVLRKPNNTDIVMTAHAIA